MREDCPYLHKKLSAKAEVCVDFLKGFCKLAEKCNKRHEFVCPDLEAKGKCDKVKCLYCKKQQMSLNNKKEAHPRKTIVSASVMKEPTKSPSASVTTVEPTDTPAARYFITSKDSIQLGEIAKVSELNDESLGDANRTSDSEIDEEDTTASSVPRRTRPQLGDLPAFIPFS